MKLVGLVTLAYIGVGGSINLMNNSNIQFMNKFLKAFAGAAVAFSMLLTLVASPASVLAQSSNFGLSNTDFGSGLGASFNSNPSDSFSDTADEVDTSSGSGVVSSDSAQVSSGASAYVKCTLKSTVGNTIYVGDSITLDWTAEDATSVTINGEAVSGESGSKTYTNIRENTKYTIVAKNGNSSCTQEVYINCIPPEVPKECELEIRKSVDKYNAVVGEQVMYTITVENTGDADCTGGGVKIFDEVDTNIKYKSNTVSNNLSVGYGNKPVYTNADRTLRFNGHDLTPGEKGTITWVGEVTEPNQCGDFTVKNQAKTTAKELNNFYDWVYSNTVKTEIDNDCDIPVCEPGDQNYNPEADLRGTIYDEGKGRVTNSSEYCDYKVGLASYEKFDEIIDNQNLFDSATGIVEAKSTIELMVSVPNCAYQIDLFYGHVLTSLDGQRYGERKLDWKHLNSDKEYCGVEKEEFATVVAEKIICTDETQLPNYASDFQSAPDITANTAANWVANNASCRLVPGWEFEYTDDQSADPGDTFTGKAGSPWTSFGPTDTNGKTEVQINLDTLTNQKVWFREVLKGGFIPFTHGQNNQTNVDDVSAEMYCDTDVKNFDNRDFIEGMEDGKTYYCVAWNSPEPEVEDPVPVCKSFTATPGTLAIGGGDVELAWEIVNGQTATITPNIGAVDQTGTRTVSNVTQDTTFVLTAEDNNGDKTSCQASVVVPDTEPVFSCEANVNFSVSDSSIDRGDDTTLTWSTTDVDTVFISQIDATDLSGSETVSPSSDTTYVLTATKGDKSVDCPVSVDVSSGGGGGGGGGGSSSPRCELEISDEKIRLGEEITLTWDTSRATEITITDDEGEMIFTTDDYLASDKEDFFDGSITIEPTRDTEYTLLAERGSRDRECKVEVEVEDEIVVLEDRDQQPLVAGISLTQVPYTGFEAGPFMTYLFYLLLGVWSLFITYLLVMRNKAVPATASAETATVIDRSEENLASMKKAEAVRPDVFTPSVMTQVAESQTAPANLPTGVQFAGQDVMKTTAVNENPHQATDATVTELENRAHEQNALLSSDAVRHFIATTEGSVERNEALDSVISEAKKSYPLEDGWVVINEARMQNLCEVCQVNAEVQKEEAFVPSTVPTGSGSLAEAIVTGNVVAAYEMIGNRPMFSVADAAADLDAVYRNRQGANETVSDLLEKETANLTDKQIQKMIAALTGALDGTYTDEASAVKMAIMKAVKVVA